MTLGIKQDQFKAAEQKMAKFQASFKELTKEMKAVEEKLEKEKENYKRLKDDYDEEQNKVRNAITLIIQIKVIM